MKRFLTLFFIITVLFLSASSIVLFAESKGEQANTTLEKSNTSTISNADGVAKDQGFQLGKFIGAGLSMGLAAIGAGVGVGLAAAAAIGAVSEKPSMIGPSLIFVALAEGICLWGFIIAFMILGK